MLDCGGFLWYAIHRRLAWKLGQVGQAHPVLYCSSLPVVLMFRSPTALPWSYIVSQDIVKKKRAKHHSPRLQLVAEQLGSTAIG